MPSRMIYRSIALHVQNSSPELLSVEAVNLGPGTWLTPPPSHGAPISPHSHGRWQVGSDRLAVGLAGWIRLACTRGYVSLGWKMEWVGPLIVSHETTADSISITTSTNDEEPPFPECRFTVMVATQRARLIRRMSA